MIRIRAAEKMILEEETSQGRILRDEYGRLVPDAARASIDARSDALKDFNSISTERLKLVEKQKNKEVCLNEKKYASVTSLTSDAKGTLKGKFRAFI